MGSLSRNIFEILLRKTDYMRSKIRGCMDFSFTANIEQNEIILRASYYTGELFQKSVKYDEFLGMSDKQLDEIVKEYF